MKSAPLQAIDISSRSSSISIPPSPPHEILTFLDNVFVGFGLSAGDKEVRPAAVFLGLPNRAYDIRPVHKYYIIAGGDYIPGQVIDVDKVGEKSPVVDLTTGLSLVTHKSGGDWAVGPFGG